MKFAPGFNPFSLPRPPSNNPFGGYGGMGQQFGGGGGPLAPLGSAITQQLSEKQQPEVQEFMGEVTDMANERFEIDLGAVGQRPMFSQVARPAVQMYKNGGAAFPDVTGPGGGPPDGKVTQADVLKLRGVELKEYGGPIGMEAGGPPLGEGRVEASRKAFDAIMLFRRTLENNGMTLEDFVNKPSRFQSEFLSMLPVDSESFKDIIEYKSTFGSPLKRTPAENMALERKNLSDTLQGLQSDVDTQIERAKALQNRVQDKGEAIQKIKGMQMGGDPMTAPPMPMPMQDQLDPNVVQSALAQAAGGIGDLDEAQNYEQVMNTMRGDQATVEERRQELAGVVGPGDANQTPESVLTLVQPVMMLANVDQGIGALAQQEMTQPMEGPMAGGIMSTVPEPPMMEAGGTAPVNFNRGGEVRPIQNFANGGNVGFGDMRLSQLGVNLADPSQTEPLILNIVNQAKNQEQAQPGTGKNLINNFFEKRRDLYRQIGLGDPKARAAMAEDQKRMTRAQILFDIATTALAFAAPMEGERPGLSPAERLAMAARSTQLPEKIGARAQAQLQSEKEAAKEERAIDLAALQAAEAEATAARAAAEARALAELKDKTKTTKPMYYEDKTGKKTFFDGNTQYGTFSKLQIEQGGAIYDVGTKPTTKSTKDFVTLQTPTGERSRLFDLNKETDLLEFREFEKNNPGSKPLKIATDTAPVDLEEKAAQKFGFTSVKELQEYKQQNPDGYQALMGDPNVITNKDYFTKFGLTIEQFKLLDDKVKRRLTEVDPETEVRVVDNQIIDITDIKNPKHVFGTKSLKTTTIKGQLIDFTDPDNVRVLFSDPDVKTTTVNGEVVDITDPANPKVIFGEKDRKTLTLKGEVIDITNPDDVKVIYGNKDRVLKIVKGQLVEVPEEGDPIPIFGERTPETGTFENMLLNTGEMILVKKVGEDLYDTDGTKIDRAADRYKDALLISKDTAFDVSTTAKSQAKFKEQLLEVKGLQSDNELRNQILNPVGRLAGVLPTNQQERSQVMKITFDALRDARKGVGFYNKLKQVFSEYVGGVFPPLQDAFADEVQAGNFVTAANVLIRVALANSPRFAEGEQERLGAILPNAERLFANPENAVRKFIGVKKLLRQEKINVLEILSQETDTNILRENKRQLYAINSALKMLETIPDVGFVNTEEFENTMEILQKRRQERGG